MEEKRIGKFRKEYLSGFLTSFIILAFGIAFEWINKGEGVFLPSWPQNAMIGISFVFILMFLHFFYSDFNVVRWLSRIPASISAIALFTFLTLILGLTQQNNPDAPKLLKFSGLNHIRSSFTFLFSGLYLLTTLGLVILRRFKSLTYRNIGFALNHIGLWLIVLTGSLGSGDLMRLNIYVNENESAIYGYNKNRQALKLPFTIRLLDFNIEDFNPKLAFVDNIDKSIPKEIENNLVMIEEGIELNIAGWDIEVSEFISSAIMDSFGSYIYSEDTIAIPVARIHVINEEAQLEYDEYISCGNMMVNPKILKLDDKYSLAMTLPEPREYSSLIELIDSKGQIDTTKLIVNKPVRIDSWKLYQLSYDERLGKWSQLSVIEAIRDPWLPIIYLGVFMIIAGSIYLFSIGKTPNEEVR